MLRAGPLGMGRGNWIPKGVGSGILDYGGYYVAIDYNEENPFETDCFIRNLKQTVINEMMEMYPSFVKTKKWEHDGEVILVNNLAQVVLADNEWSMAVYVVIPDTERYPYAELGKKQLKNYLVGLKMLLLKYYPDQVRVRTGPWTSGILRLAM